MSQPLISVIIIEYFSLDCLNTCILSIQRELREVDHEIIISSNSNYNISEQKEITAGNPGIAFYFNERNGGFAYGMNRGLEMAKGRYLTIVNPDAIVTAGFIEILRFMEKHHEIGAAGPQIINPEGIVQDSFRKYVSVPRFIVRHLKRMFRDIPVLEKGIDSSKIQTVDWISGGFIVVSRQSYEATMGLDEKYFLYAEDVDWCTRIRAAGFEIVYFPEMKVVFAGSRSARKLNKFTLVFIKSHLRYWIKFGFFSGYPERKELLFDE